ncbi:hypothetical protein [Chryseobacterium wangxinyae]|uniref:hypothetical protein n=1 Tax=Chryseobacterium sp. CY353 TaxID=2997334 RepID=UPI00226FD0D2|nr:hypothetical protein [Chryseobacterium sp. CY353]MCY0968143.1 hypothetical protein [Chryseobacterium sp. CY353]
MKVLSEQSGFSIEELKKMFSNETSFGLMDINYNNLTYADYPHTEHPTSYPVNLVRINDGVLNWFQNANVNTSTFEGVRNVFYMASIIAHEITHWGDEAGRRSSKHIGTGHFDVGFKFERALLGGSVLGSYDYGFKPGLNNYVKNNFTLLQQIFKSK